MTASVNVSYVRDSLTVFSSEGEQRRLWLSDGHLGRDVGSFGEAFCGLFDDSQLGDELESGRSVFDQATDNEFKRLHSLLGRINDQRHPWEVIADPAMVDVRVLAGRLLKRIDN